MNASRPLTPSLQSPFLKSAQATTAASSYWNITAGIQVTLAIILTNTQDITIGFNQDLTGYANLVGGIVSAISKPTSKAIIDSTLASLN